MSDFPVKVHIYDISKGLARSMSMALIGRQIDGIWHTGIVVHGQEFFFGGDGINNCPPSGTILGPPDSIVDLGRTQIPLDMFMDYLSELSQTSFRPECYHLLDHNCNNFSSEVAQFLTGRDIPRHITNLSSEVLQTPMGAMLKTFIDNMSSGFGHPTFERNRNANNQNDVQATLNSTTPASSEKTKPDGAAANTRSLVTFTGSKVDISSIKDLVSSGSEDLTRLEAFCEFASSDSCSWSIGKTHIDLLETLLLKKETPSEKKVKLLDILQKLVLSEDTVSMLAHYNCHGLMEYACNISQLRRGEQINLMKVLSNCCASQKGVDWLTSMKDFTVENMGVTNCGITGGCCVFCLLQENQEVREMGATLSYNLTMYKLSDDTSVEIGSAILQCLMGELTEVTAFYCLSALKILMTSNQEVTDLACVMGVEVEKLKKMSSRIEMLTKDLEPMLQ